MTTADPSAEARSGLEPWVTAELPEPPRPTGFGWLGVVGPGVIVLGLSIGSGEFLLGPAAFVRHGLSLLWVTLVAIFFQTMFNLELMRYTVATGEPVFTGFMRTRPSSKLWAIFYAGLLFLQIGWPAWAATAAGAVFFLVERRIAASGDATIVYYLGCASFLICVFVLLFGRRVERTLEILNWVMVTCVLGALLVLAVMFVPGSTWADGLAGFVGYDAVHGNFEFLPPGVDYILLAALVGYSGAGGCSNIVLSNWARDKGYGMGERAGYIPAVVGGKRVNLAHTGFRVAPGGDSMRRWRGWWRIVKADQWGVFFCGAVLGMLLPALLYVTFLPAGTDIRGLGIAAALAQSVSERSGPLLGGGIALLGAWLLLKTQLDQIEGLTRSVTDILWTGSPRVRAWRGGDVRAVYYTVLVAVAIWGMIALRLAQPVMLLQIGANIAGAVFIIASLHLLYINTRLLPVELRPPTWRRAALVGMSLFYGLFTTLSVIRLVQ
jgi:hypothetical protein